MGKGLDSEVTDLLRDVFGDPNLGFDRSTSAEDVEGWDSARMVEIIVAAEDRFSVAFTTREIDGLGNVGDLIDLIAAKTKDTRA